VKIAFFRTPLELRNWFEQNHATARELWVGFYKKGSGEASITWPESVDEALCLGWIDCIRKSVDDLSYKIRFTPRAVRQHLERGLRLLRRGFAERQSCRSQARERRGA
jgi:uncharacterized protein YdeI (YjbR/CyaY-like superfamily)